MPIRETNDEIRMTNVEGMTKPEMRPRVSFFVILSLFRDSTFVLRYFPDVYPCKSMAQSVTSVVNDPWFCPVIRIHPCNPWLNLLG